MGKFYNFEYLESADRTVKMEIWDSGDLKDCWYIWGNFHVRSSEFNFGVTWSTLKNRSDEVVLIAAPPLQVNFPNVCIGLYVGDSFPSRALQSIYTMFAASTSACVLRIVPNPLKVRHPIRGTDALYFWPIFFFIFFPPPASGYHQIWRWQTWILGWLSYLEYDFLRLLYPCLQWFSSYFAFPFYFKRKTRGPWALTSAWEPTCPVIAHTLPLYVGVGVGVGGVRFWHIHYIPPAPGLAYIAARIPGWGGGWAN